MLGLLGSGPSSGPNMQRHPIVRFYEQGGAVWWGPHVGGVPASFSRASRAWNGSRLVGANVRRVYGEDSDSPAMLIEGQRTNLLPNSQDFAVWGDGAVVTPNTHVAPDGTQTADTIEDNGAGSAVGRTTSLTVPNDANPYTYSIRIRKSDVDVFPGFEMQFAGGTGKFTTLVFNTRDGVVASHNGLDAWDVRADPTNSDYWLATATASNNALGNTTLNVRLFPAYSGGAGGGYSPSATGSVVAWGAQVEQEAFPTSYIPTEDAPAARADEDFRATLGLQPSQALTMHMAFMRPHSDKLFYLMDDGWLGARIWGDDTRNPGVVSHLGAVGNGVWCILSTVFDGDAVTDHLTDATGALLTASGTLVRDYDAILTPRIGSRNAGNYVHGFLAPGSAPIGIPFIDSRIWTDTEIAEAHDSWLTALNTLELPL